MKRIIATILTICLVLSATACANKNDNKNSTEKTNENTTENTTISTEVGTEDQTDGVTIENEMSESTESTDIDIDEGDTSVADIFDDIDEQLRNAAAITADRVSESEDYRSEEIWIYNNRTGEYFYKNQKYEKADEIYITKYTKMTHTILSNNGWESIQIEEYPDEERRDRYVVSPGYIDSSRTDLDTIKQLVCGILYFEPFMSTEIEMIDDRNSSHKIISLNQLYSSYCDDLSAREIEFVVDAYTHRLVEIAIYPREDKWNGEETIKITIMDEYNIKVDQELYDKCIKYDHGYDELPTPIFTDNFQKLEIDNLSNPCVGVELNKPIQDKNYFNNCNKDDVMIFNTENDMMPRDATFDELLQPNELSILFHDNTDVSQPYCIILQNQTTDAITMENATVAGVILITDFSDCAFTKCRQVLGDNYTRWIDVDYGMTMTEWTLSEINIAVGMSDYVFVVISSANIPQFYKIDMMQIDGQTSELSKDIKSVLSFTFAQYECVINETTKSDFSDKDLVKDDSANNLPYTTTKYILNTDDGYCILYFDGDKKHSTLIGYMIHFDDICDDVFKTSGGLTPHSLYFQVEKAFGAPVEQDDHIAMWNDEDNDLFWCYMFWETDNDIAPLNGMYVMDLSVYKYLIFFNSIGNGIKDVLGDWLEK